MKLPVPRSELYLRGDIANVLKAIDAANSDLSAALPLPEVTAYRTGFLAALRAVALAFDVDGPAAPPISLVERHRRRGNYLAGEATD